VAKNFKPHLHDHHRHQNMKSSHPDQYMQHANKWKENKKSTTY